MLTSWVVAGGLTLMDSGVTVPGDFRYQAKANAMEITP